MRRLLLVLTVVASISGCAARGEGPLVSEARIGVPTGPNAALYLTASSGADDRLVGARTEVATSIELHETTHDDDGTTGMRPIAGIPLTPGEPLVLEPGGYHLMLVEVDELQVGDTVEVTLVWEEAGEMVVAARVVEPDATMSHDG